MVQVPGITELVVVLLVLVMMLAMLAVFVVGVALLVAFLTDSWVFADSEDDDERNS